MLLFICFDLDSILTEWWGWVEGKQEREVVFWMHEIC